jgi:hypothetical protein
LVEQGNKTVALLKEDMLKKALQHDKNLEAKDIELANLKAQIANGKSFANEQTAKLQERVKSLEAQIELQNEKEKELIDELRSLTEEVSGR